MDNELTVYEAQQAVCVSKRGNYEITSPLTGKSVTLKRDVDFGVIPKTKKPSLFKSGAENICMAYGLMQRYSIESKIERLEDPVLFYYLIKCELVKISFEGKEYVFSVGYGSANTTEKRNGFNGPYDSANNTVKMAQKRALVSAALAVSGLSTMFTQDMENEEFMKGYNEILDTQDENSPITAKQIKRIYALANEAGYNASQAKNKIISMGYASTKDIKQSDYDDICNIFQNESGDKT